MHCIAFKQFFPEAAGKPIQCLFSMLLLGAFGEHSMQRHSKTYKTLQVKSYLFVGLQSSFSNKIGLNLLFVLNFVSNHLETFTTPPTHLPLSFSSYFSLCRLQYLLCRVLSLCFPLCTPSHSLPIHSILSHQYDLFLFCLPPPSSIPIKQCGLSLLPCVLIFFSATPFPLLCVLSFIHLSTLPLQFSWRG